jgi:hypothetical protein
MTGVRCGRLVALYPSSFRSPEGRLQWVCRCDCGNEATIPGKRLRDGHTRSCGCLHVERFYAMITKHGMRDSREYSSWRNMKMRCLSSDSDDYHNYGGRGITIHPTWLASFTQFYDDMGPCPSGLTLERINVNGNYEPGNCKWATWKDQANNKRERTTCFKGHELAGDNLRVVRGRKRCLICLKAAWKKGNARRVRLVSNGD